MRTLKEVATAHNYSSLANAGLTKIIPFNRRRVGEVAKMKLQNFMVRDRTKSNEITVFSEFEQNLRLYFECINCLTHLQGRQVP